MVRYTCSRELVDGQEVRMNLQLINKAQRRQSWSDMVMRCRNSDLTVAQWCELEGISVATYHYRQKQVLHSLTEQTEVNRSLFAAVEVKPDIAVRNNAAITISMGRVQIAVEPGVDAHTLATVLETIERLC